MSVIDAYLRLVSRWRWSFLLAMLIGSFLLQAILPNGPSPASRGSRCSC